MPYIAYLPYIQNIPYFPNMPYQTDHTHHTYPTYHTTPHHTTGGGEGDSATSPPHTGGGRGKISYGATIWDPSHGGGRGGRQGLVHILYIYIFIHKIYIFQRLIGEVSCCAMQRLSWLIVRHYESGITGPWCCVCIYIYICMYVCNVCNVCM